MKIIAGKCLTAVVCLALPLTTVFSYHKQASKILTESIIKKNSVTFYYFCSNINFLCTPAMAEWIKNVTRGTESPQNGEHKNAKWFLLWPFYSRAPTMGDSLGKLIFCGFSDQKIEFKVNLRRLLVFSSCSWF